MNEGWGKKIILSADISFSLFECRDDDDCTECNFFAKVKLNLDSLGGICVRIISVAHDRGCYFPISKFHLFVILNCTVWRYGLKSVLVIVLNVMGDYFWVHSNDPFMDSNISYIHDGERVNVWCETNLWVILDASKTDINGWGVFVNGEGHTTGEGHIIVTIDFITNKK